MEDSGEDSDCYEIVDKPSTTGMVVAKFAVHYCII